MSFSCALALKERKDKQKAKSQIILFKVVSPEKVDIGSVNFRDNSKSREKLLQIDRKQKYATK